MRVEICVEAWHRLLALTSHWLWVRWQRLSPIYDRLSCREHLDPPITVLGRASAGLDAALLQSLVLQVMEMAIVVPQTRVCLQMSTGEGKAKVLDEKETTVYKRALDQEYKLKLKASRQIFSEINKKYPTMPFTVRSLDSKQGRLGLVECLNHGLLHPYPVLHEKASLCTW